MPQSEFLQHTFSLEQRVAVITGASSGLGAHMALTLARAGCRVVLAARRKDKLESLAARIGEHGTETLPLVMDVNDRHSVETAFAHCVAHFGRVDILVNNAGIADSQEFLTMTEHAWQRVLDTDLSAVWRVAQVAAQQMIAQVDDANADVSVADSSHPNTSGVIINIASILGIATRRSQANYSAAKAGVIQLTKSMALELARKGVRVNALAPGYFTTEMNETFLASERGREYIARLLPQRVGQLSEIDGALLLLASDAGSYINGSVISVDGGTLLAGM